MCVCIVYILHICIPLEVYSFHQSGMYIRIYTGVHTYELMYIAVVQHSVLLCLSRHIDFKSVFSLRAAKH